ncbi:hypothetical protein SAY87_014655 [Trapa incisa]|uniref:Uncharacterized protein n=1 Tax=Trapa incisa TaxID=236973 RepID=A0AAN7GSZ4_9MYRT|nr:hypothetical protein SAY87_014655 [Trapa incisa]
MASGGTLFPSTYSSAISVQHLLLTLLLFLIVSVPSSSMEENEESLSSLSSSSPPSGSGSTVSNNRLKISSRRHKAAPSSTATLSSTGMMRGPNPKGVGLPWQEKVFGAGEHEVPSGPNPISNR